MNLDYFEEIGYFHGRFQPFHLGHLNVVKFALERSAILVIGISNPFRIPPVVEDYFNKAETESLLIARNPENNPWPYWARMLMIREGLRQEGIALERIMFIPNLSNTGLPTDEIRLPKEIATVYICPKDYHNKAVAKKYREDGWKVIEVPLDNRIIGSRSLREKIRSGQDWESLVPKGTAAVIKALG